MSSEIEAGTFVNAANQYRIERDNQRAAAFNSGIMQMNSLVNTMALTNALAKSAAR